MIEDGTAIGNAIANGVNRLKDSDSNLNHYPLNRWYE